jgi:predicted RNA-binding Zn ribbon-like protein
MTDFPPLYGVDVCLDFANTVDARGETVHEEHLHDYADLVRWAAYAHLIEPGTARDLTAVAEARPEAARASYLAGLAVREAIFRIFAQDAPPDVSDLDLIQRGYAAAMSAARLRPAAGRFAWTLPGDDLDRPWWPAAIAAVELLTAGPVDRVKECSSEAGCRGLFLDTSKNGSRRWCRMEDCGTEAKIHRQTARRRAARG